MVCSCAGGRFANGYTLTAAYTFGKALAYVVPSSTIGGSAIPAYYRAKNYGPASTDIASNFQATAIAELPFGKGKHWAQSGLAASILGGWQINDVFSAYGGRPFTALSSNTSLNAPNSTSLQTA